MDWWSLRHFRVVSTPRNPINDIVAYDGYLFGGGPEGRLHVVSARPWVYPGSVALRRNGSALPADEVVERGDELELVFTVDEDVDYTIYAGGSRFADGRLLIDAGDGSAAAEVEEVVQLTVGEAGFAEGENRIYIVATNDRLLDGHARTQLTIDDAPLPPELNGSSVEFGEGELTLVFEGIEDEDLDHYDIYVATEAWDPSDFADGGGPTFDGKAELETPIRVDAVGGQSQSVRIRPLENNVTYYIGVRATDTGGKEGPMSAVVSGTPRETFTAAELAGETGGGPCHNRRRCDGMAWSWRRRARIDASA